MNEDDEIIKIYSALGHPARKKIVEILGDKQRLGFKELKDALNVSVGTVYFHLETLSDLVTQDKDRKYFLTDKGRRALQIIASGDEHVETTESMLSKHDVSVGSRLVKGIVFGRFLLIKVNSNPKRFIPEIGLVLALGAWMFASNGVEPIMMFYNSRPTWSSPLVLAAEFLGSWCLIFVLLELFSYAFYRRGEGKLSLLVGTIFSLAPTLIPLSIVHLNRILVLGISINWLWLNVLLLALQGWVICILTANLSLAKGFRIEKAALITMVIMYLNIAIFALAYLI